MASEPLTERLEALDDDTRAIVIELAATIATRESLDGAIVPDSVTALAEGQTLLERLNGSLGTLAVAPTIEDEPSSAGLDLSGTSLDGEPNGLGDAAPHSRIDLFQHPHTPVEMRNFLSLVMPAGRLSEEAFDLHGKSASLLSYTLVKIYSELPLYVDIRHRNSELISKHIGLNGKSIDAHDLYPGQPQKGLRRIDGIIKTMNDHLSIEVRAKALELAQGQDEDEILAFIQQTIEVAHKAHSGIEAEPIPEGFERRIIKDVNGKQHAILWNTETLNIIVDGVEYPATNLGNVFRDRLAIVKCLMKNKGSSLSSSQLHKKGVGKLGKQTEAAVKQAIRMALKEVEQISVQVGSDTVSLLGYASPRTYQLHEQLGGPKVDQKRFVKRGERSRDQVGRSEKRVSANDKLIRLTRDGIVIKGEVYEVFDEAERDTLRPIVETKTRTLEIDEVSGLAHGVNEPTDEQIKDTRIVLYELTRRGIVSEKVVDGSVRYIVNENVEEYLEDLTDIRFGNNNVVYLRQWDIEIIKAFMLSARPLDIHEVARRIQPAERLPADEFKDLVLTIRDYLSPHGIVHRERLPKDQGGAITDRYLMSDKIKNGLTESGIIV